MMSIGQSRAHSVHLMQRSMSSRNMPRKRLAGSMRSSGYWMVTFLRRMCLKVNPRPAKRSSSKMRSRNRLTALIAVTSLAPGQPQLHRAGQEHVGERQRDHPLPAQVHELVEAIAREGAAEPDVDEQEDEDLEREPDLAREADRQEAEVQP